jgi:anti-anti-sigma factor
MDISEEKNGTVAVVGLKGRLDAIQAKTVEERLLKLIDSGEHRLVIDLGGVDYISSIGLRALMVAAKRLKTVNGTVVVCALSAPIRKVFDLAGFLTLFKVFTSREEAIQALA